jgi:hypothetical protein
MKKLLVIIFISLLTSIRIFSQDTSNVATKDDVAEVKGAVDGLNESFLETKATVDALKKIKISGYIQAQWQLADNNGAASFAGGNFPANLKSRFLVRRGRVKVNYDNTSSQYVLQIDVTQSGVGIKDAYASFKEPWLNSFSLTGGVFDRPFGFEISYSSSSREAPERSRLFQTLFPGERELGVKLEYSTESGPLSFLNLKAGLFNGTGPTAVENDNNKDFIGRLGFSFPFTDVNLAVDGGISAYIGKVQSNTKYIYKYDGASKMAVDSTSTNLGTDYKRNYVGADLQIYYDLPVIGGFSLRGEYIAGTQPGLSGSNTFYNSTDSKAALYSRKFNGYYVNYIQNIGEKNQFVLKYDVLDPNSEVSGDQIGVKGANLSTGDVKYSTLGIGWIYHWDGNVKLVLYYDMVKNEKVNAAATGSLAPFKEDLKDNVLTFRIQYKF